MNFRNTVLSCVAIALAVVWLAAPLGAQAGDNNQGKIWIVDLEKAKELAAKNKTDILMEFTGSDWCPPCIKLKKTVLDKDVFKETAPKHFVLLKLDSPRDKSKQTKEEIQQYRTLSKKFSVTGVPTIILADATGKPYAKIVGYGGQAADVYTQSLVKKIDVRKKRDEFFAKAKSAEGVARAKLLDKAIGGIDAELALAEYRDTVDEIIKLDADNKGKLKQKYENRAKLTDVKSALQKIQVNAGKDADAALKSVNELITKEKLTGEPLQEALFVKGAILFRSDKAASRTALQEAIEAAPDTARASRIRTIIKSAFKDSK